AVAGDVLQTRELAPIGRADVLERMRAARAILRCDVRPLEMATGDHLIGPVFFFAGGPDRSESGGERLIRIRDERRAQARDAKAKVRLKRLEHVVGREVFLAEPRAAVAVDLQVKE